MFTIIGSGFGLYGYLPSVVNVLRGRVLLPSHYQEVIKSRIELDRYTKYITWCSSQSEAINNATGIIVAVTPEAQMRLIDELLGLNKLEKLIIEKPVCPSPQEAVALVKKLQKSRKRFRVGYTFLYTDWLQSLQSNISQLKGRLHINWKFRAHHFVCGSTTWKRYDSKGGGALRFYGIHILAALAQLGYEEVTVSALNGAFSDSSETWNAQLTGTRVPPCTVSVSTNTEKTGFSLRLMQDDGRLILHRDQNGPFGSSDCSGSQDLRVPMLERLIQSFESTDTEFEELYERTNSLWLQSEELSAAIR